MAQREGRRPASCTPQSAARFVRRGAAALRAGHARPWQSVPGLSRERCALIAWAEQAGRLVPFDYVERFACFGAGAEHSVYHDTASNLAVKVTLGGRFGHSLAREGASGTPFEYLNRLGWHNLMFGDEISIIGVSYDGEEHVEVIHSQPWITPHLERPKPYPDEINEYFAGYGFFRSEANPDAPLFYNPRFDLMVADAHDANVIRDLKGELFAIDVVIGHPGPEMMRLYRG